MEGDNSFTAGTTVSAGTLRVTGAGDRGAGAVAVAAPATFDLSEKATSLTLGSGFALNGSLAMTASMSFSSLAGSGVFAFGDDSVLLRDVAGITTYGSYALISGYSSYTNFSGLESTLSGQFFEPTNYTVSIEGGALTLTVVPEPHVYALGIAGLAVLIVVVRRRRMLA